MRIEVELEDDGRCITEVTELPGVIVYGANEAEVRESAAALARYVLADRAAHREDLPFDPS
ncbi:MAG: type II toxin-antitoxin system HicB family antitoxin [Hyphomicrobiales bacterium]|nr:MAG: type II toxin-antitoxin system HicB family antitoxin [Hyphomicrobiales bacterium]